MRVVLIGLALLGMTAPVSAGVYCTFDPTPPELPPERIRSWVAQLRAVAVPPKEKLDPASLRGIFDRHRATLEEQKANGVFSTIDRLNLSACYIRLGEMNKAIRLLSSGPDRKHFLVQANLASAYFLRGLSLQAEGDDLLIAHRYQEQALDAWPDVWAPFGPGQLVHYRRCERVFLTLLEKRREETTGPRRNASPLEVDAIFPGFRLVGPGPAGEYEAGGHSPKVLDRLPVDAYSTVLQLVVWYPQDLRLYWLLGEFLNVFGHVVPASEILTELSANDLPFKDLAKHRRVLRAGAALLAALKIQSPSTRALLLGCLSSIPNGGLPPAGAGAAVTAISVAAPMEWARLIENPPQNTAPTPGPTGPSVTFGWQHVLGSFAFGFVVAALLGFEMQARRRRRMRQEIDPEEEEPATPSEKESTPQ